VLAQNLEGSHFGAESHPIVEDAYAGRIQDRLARTASIAPPPTGDIRKSRVQRTSRSQDQELFVDADRGGEVGCDDGGKEGAQVHGSFDSKRRFELPLRLRPSLRRRPEPSGAGLSKLHHLAPAIAAPLLDGDEAITLPAAGCSAQELSGP
jgi:hypothetical protein